MNPGVVVAIVVVIVVLVLVAFLAYRQRRSSQLRQQFGPEYDRAVGQYGDRKSAEPALLDRKKRVEGLDIRPLPDTDRQRFADEWRRVQAQFVDDPAAAVREADRLVTEVMNARGYPMGDFEQRAADISVDHSNVVTNYRIAHDIALRQEQGQADTEALRTALIHYRALFQDLLESPETRKAKAGR